MASDFNTYDRYSKFMENGRILNVPFITIPKKNTDRVLVYKRGVHRMDNISYDYYGNPNYGWLILMANPNYTMEFQIPDGMEIRIPYPLETTLNQYQASLDAYIENYSLD